MDENTEQRGARKIRTRRLAIVTAGPLAVFLVLGASGLVFAQDPSATKSGFGMMGGKSWAGVTSQAGPTMMGSARMMYGSPMLLGRTADQLRAMQALHDEMLAAGRCDPADMLDILQ
jgi:hypothetical protein